MDNTIKNLAFAVLLLFVLPDFLLADTLFLKSGKVLECRILEKTSDYVKVEYSGQPLYFELKYVRQIDQEPSVPVKGPASQGASAEQWSREIAEEISKSRAVKVRAVIAASVLQGFSPLKVVFNGLRSFSSEGRITSYRWDFGDGDTSCSPRVSNTYISMSYGTRIYTVELTVEDEKGNCASEQANICVVNRDL